MSFQENLKYYREKAGYKQAKDFAQILNISYSTYVGYESKNREPKYEMLCKIADLLEVSTDDLLGRTSNILVKTKNNKDDKYNFLFNKPYKLERANKMTYSGIVAYDMLQMVQKQKEQWGDEKHLLPHQWLGLIGEEIGEMTEAVNETYLSNRTKEHLGGIEHIQEEAIQAMALIVRFIESINEEK